MRDPAFADDLRVKIENHSEVVPALPKNLLKKRVPNDLNPALKKSFFIHGALVFLFLVQWGYEKFWVSDAERIQRLKEQQNLKTAIRVDLVDLPSLKLSELQAVDLSKDPDPVPVPQEKQAEPEKEIKQTSETAMVDRTQKNEDQNKNSEKNNNSKRLKELQDSLRAEQKRKELVAGLKKQTRPLLGGNIVSEGYSMTGDVATDKEVFGGKVQAHVVKNFNVPSWMNSSNFKAQVAVKIAPDGRVLSYELVQSSQNSEFDQAALRAIQQSDPFPSPPESLRRVFLEEGILCGFP
jgi:colicin import membrane protein